MHKRIRKPLKCYSEISNQAIGQCHVFPSYVLIAILFELRFSVLTLVAIVFLYFQEPSFGTKGSPDA